MSTSRGKKPASKKTAFLQAPLAQSSRGTLEAAPEDYADWIRDVKARVHEARRRAARAVHSELVGLSWRIGRDTRARQQTQGWGAKIVDRISTDLKTELPDSEGFSPRNLMYMRAFAVAWPSREVVQQPVGRLPWGHDVVLLTRLKDQSLEVARWLATPPAVHIRLRPLEWFQKVLQLGEKHSTYREKEVDDDLAKLLNMVWEQDQHRLRASSASFVAFRGLLAWLVERQNPLGLELQGRIGGLA